MHTPDHLVPPSAEIGAGVVAAAAVALAAGRARAELHAPDAGGSRASRTARLGMVAATTGLIFGAQMLNFPVASGTSGHLLGGALAVALLGPWTGLLSITAVLAVQSLLFADGGLAALGVNVTVMGVVGVATGWAVMTAVLRLTGRGRGRATLASGLAAFGSVPVAAIALAALAALPGSQVAAPAVFAREMLAVHAVIGVGEAVITAVLVALVLALNPSLTYVGRRHGLAPAVRAPMPVVVGAVGALALVAAGVLARFASPHPDGLEFVAQSLGVELTEGGRALLSYDLAAHGMLGVLAVAALALLVLLPASRGSSRVRS